MQRVVSVSISIVKLHLFDFFIINVLHIYDVYMYNCTCFCYVHISNEKNTFDYFKTSRMMIVDPENMGLETVVGGDIVNNNFRMITT